MLHGSSPIQHPNAGVSIPRPPQAYRRSSLGTRFGLCGRSSAPDCVRAPQPARAATVPPPPTDGQENDVYSRISSGEFSESTSSMEKMTRPLRKALAKDFAGPGRWLAMRLAKLGAEWRNEANRTMPVACGDIREIVGEPVFLPLYQLFLTYGPIFRLSFGPKSFVVVSHPSYIKHILLTNASNYSKGMLSELMDFVMGQGLIPANGEVWKARRQVIGPALHKKYVARMVDMFGDCAMHGTAQLDAAAKSGASVEMENFFSRFALDIIGKAVFNYDFDSLSKDDPVIKAVYTTLREAEYRSTFPLPYWKLKPLLHIVPRQRETLRALEEINQTLDGLIDRSRSIMENEDVEFDEEFLSQRDPSILHFLLASGDEVNSKQLRDDLMTLLIAGHETSAAVLTWTLYLLSTHPEVQKQVQEEVDRVLGSKTPGISDVRNLHYLVRVINESMRLYPQPYVLIRRALDDDFLGQYKVEKGTDIFIGVWNLHRSPELWSDPNTFDPMRPEWGPLDGTIHNETTKRFGYLPFGGGRRKCIGDQFALFETVVAMSVLLRRYTFSPATDAPEVRMDTGATIHTRDGLYLHITHRELGHTADAGAQDQPSESENGASAGNGAGTAGGEDGAPTAPASGSHPEVFA